MRILPGLVILLLVGGPAAGIGAHNDDLSNDVAGTGVPALPCPECIEWQHTWGAGWHGFSDQILVDEVLVGRETVVRPGTTDEIQGRSVADGTVAWRYVPAAGATLVSHQQVGDTIVVLEHSDDPDDAGAFGPVQIHTFTTLDAATGAVLATLVLDRSYEHRVRAVDEHGVVVQSQFGARTLGGQQEILSYNWDGEQVAAFNSPDFVADLLRHDDGNITMAAVDYAGLTGIVHVAANGAVWWHYPLARASVYDVATMAPGGATLAVHVPFPDDPNANGPQLVFLAATDGTVQRVHDVREIGPLPGAGQVEWTASLQDFMWSPDGTKVALAVGAPESLTLQLQVLTPATGSHVLLDERTCLSAACGTFGKVLWEDGRMWWLVNRVFAFTAVASTATTEVLVYGADGDLEFAMSTPFEWIQDIQPLDDGFITGHLATTARATVAVGVAQLGQPPLDETAATAITRYSFNRSQAGFECDEAGCGVSDSPPAI